MRKLLLSGALALSGLAATAAPLLTSTAAPAAAGASAPTHAAAPTARGIYHVPVIGKVVLPLVGGLLGSTAHTTQAQSSNWSGYADTNGTFNSVASKWTAPAVNCANSGGGLLGLGGLLGGGGAASSFWVGLDGYNSSSVEQIGTDSDCNGSTPSYYAWYEMYPNPSVTLPTGHTVYPGDQMVAWVASNANGTSFYLALNDLTHPWQFSTTQTGSGFSRSSAEVVAEAPSSCNFLFCSELALADFGRVDFSASNVFNLAGTSGSLAQFNPNQITMVSGGSTRATPSGLSADGTSFSVYWNS